MKMKVTRRDLLLAAAAAPAVRAGAAMAADSTLDRLLGRRRMVRRFTAEPVSEAVVRRLLATATRAPSAGHTEPWAFVVVRREETLRELARAAHRQMFVAEVPVAIVACADVSRSRARYQERGDRYGLIDTAFASMLLLLAVVEEGLGACFVGAFEDADVARVLRLPGHVLPVAIIPVGRPAESPGARRRRPLPAVVHDEQW
jgi:nitroreductase